jgi:hypothetical protein
MAIWFHDRRSGNTTEVAPDQHWYSVDEAIGHLKANDAPLLGKQTTVNQYSRDLIYQRAQDAINASPDGVLGFTPSVRNGFSDNEKIDTSYGFSRDALKKKADQLELDAQAKGK